MYSCITTIWVSRSCSCFCNVLINSSFCPRLSSLRSGRFCIEVNCRSRFHSKFRILTLGLSSYKFSGKPLPVAFVAGAQLPQIQNAPAVLRSRALATKAVRLRLSRLRFFSIACGWRSSLDELWQALRPIWAGLWPNV